MSKEIDNIEAAGMSIEILKHLDGLSVGQAKWVLEEAQRLLLSSTRLDINGQDFVAKVEEYAAAVRGETE